MNAETFMANFGHLADAPGGVAKLRQMILQLAVQGKLVEQDPEDEPASELLKQSAAEKERLIKAKKLRKPKELPPIEVDEVPFAVPSGWEWSRLESLQVFTNGFAFKSHDYQKTGVGLVRIGDIQDGKINANNMKFVSTTFLDKLDDRLQVRPGDLLIAMSGATTGKIGFNTTAHTFLLNQRVGKIDLLDVNPRYVSFFLTTKIQSHLRISAGSAIPNLSTSQINDTTVPVPPLAEQKRIVAKVDELMTLCDQLEAQQAERNTVHVRLGEAALARLTTAEDDRSLADAWSRVRGNFDLLYSVPENVSQLRQAILQLAVQGKLVEQDPEDEPASEALVQIDATRNELIATKQMRKAKALASINETEVPYATPASWQWARLGTIARLVEYGTSQKASEVNSGVPVLRMNNVQDGRVILDRLKYVPKTLDDLPDLYLKNNDLLFNRTNSYELVGKTGLFMGEDDKYTFASYLIRVRLFGLVYPAYVNFSMNAPYYRTTQIEPELTQQCGQANFNGTKMKNSLIPLPPLAEQKRIVAKVDELMALCDELEAQLTQQQTDADRLSEAMVGAILTEPAAAELVAT